MNVTDRDLSHYLTWDVSGGAHCNLARLRFVDEVEQVGARLELAPRDEVRVGIYFASGTECFALFLPPVDASHADVLHKFAEEIIATQPALGAEFDAPGPISAWADDRPDVQYTLSCVCNPESMPGLTAHRLGEHTAVSIYPATPAPASSVVARFTFRLLEISAARALVGALVNTAEEVLNLADGFTPPGALDFTPPEDYTP